MTMVSQKKYLLDYEIEAYTCLPPELNPLEFEHPTEEYCSTFSTKVKNDNNS